MTAAAWIVLAAALGVVLWLKVLRPFARAWSEWERTLPVLRQFIAEMGDTRHSFAILDEIVAQLRSDSGSSLRDIVTRLDVAADSAAGVAEDLAVAKGVVETVAADLAASQQRADTVTEGEPGAAADAGAQSAPEDSDG